MTMSTWSFTGEIAQGRPKLSLDTTVTKWVQCPAWDRCEFEFDFKGGVTYPERTTSEFGPRILRDGCITGTVGPGIHIEDRSLRFVVLGWLMTTQKLSES